ncbi:LysR family transcriptional regulator [Salinisphaera sp.]|uniref:LysR family transcriptional regulator n=1 Tax=Salinisphaera sp. TaxID=1914330 RepID=UPI002D7960F9|nr:LysR family transcriptional regulator [Salinisphaera sp.]HET7315768.1 LysR family transcriptional regulator [Salinisphaera sp.]
MDLKQLRYFITVAEEASFSNAAKRLHITQPPLSTAIKNLEEEMGVRLFERSTRTVRLTEAGDAFFVESQQLFIHLDQSIQTARRIGQGEIGRLSLGFVPSAASSSLPPLLKNFRQRYPGVTISLHEMNPVELVRSLGTGRVDAAFFYLPGGKLPPFGEPELASRPISREPLVVALPEDHPAAARRRIELKSLADEPFILVTGHRGSGLRELILSTCHEAQFMPNVVQEATLIQTIGGLVASGVGVALVPASLRRLQSSGVSYRQIQDNPAFVEMGIVWQRVNDNRILDGFLGVVADNTSLATTPTGATHETRNEVQSIS